MCGNRLESGGTGRQEAVGVLGPRKLKALTETVITGPRRKDRIHLGLVRDSLWQEEQEKC